MSVLDWIRAHTKPGAPPLPSPVKGELHKDAATIPGKELDAGQAAVRADVDESGYGSFVSDEKCRGLASHVLIAAAAVRDE